MTALVRQLACGVLIIIVMRDESSELQLLLANVFTYQSPTC